MSHDIKSLCIHFLHLDSHCRIITQSNEKLCKLWIVLGTINRGRLTNRQPSVTSQHSNQSALGEDPGGGIATCRPIQPARPLTWISADSWFVTLLPGLKVSKHNFLGCNPCNMSVLIYLPQLWIPLSTNTDTDHRKGSRSPVSAKGIPFLVQLVWCPQLLASFKNAWT